MAELNIIYFTEDNTKNKNIIFEEKIVMNVEVDALAMIDYYLRHKGDISDCPIHEKYTIPAMDIIIMLQEEKAPEIFNKEGKVYLRKNMAMYVRIPENIILFFVKYEDEDGNSSKDILNKTLMKELSMIGEKCEGAKV